MFQLLPVLMLIRNTAISRGKRGHFVPVLLRETEHGHLTHKISIIIVLFHDCAAPNFPPYSEASEPGGVRPNESNSNTAVYRIHDFILRYLG
jgi:hypothetical protein